MMQTQLAGHRQKPSWVNHFALLYFALPLLTVTDILGKTLNPSADLITMILFDIAGCWLGAVAIFIISRPTIIIFAFLSGMMMIVKFMQVAEGVLSPWAGFGVLGVWMITALLMVATSRERPYLYPKIRWWTQPERFVHVMHGSLLFQGLKFPVVTLNVSRGGVFLKLDERILAFGVSRPGEPAKNDRRDSQKDLKGTWTDHEIKMAKARIEAYPDAIGQEVVIQLVVSENAQSSHPMKTLTSRAKVAWVAQAGSDYRFGLGLELVHQGLAEKKAWQLYIKNLENRAPRNR